MQLLQADSFREDWLSKQQSQTLSINEIRQCPFLLNKYLHGWLFASATWWSLWRAALRLQEDWCTPTHSLPAPRVTSQASPGPGPGPASPSGGGSRWNTRPPSPSWPHLPASLFLRAAGWSGSPASSRSVGWPPRETKSNRTAPSRRSHKRPRARHSGAAPLLDAPSRSRGTQGRTRSPGETPHPRPGSAPESSTWLQPRRASLWIN